MKKTIGRDLWVPFLWLGGLAAASAASPAAPAMAKTAAGTEPAAAVAARPAPVTPEQMKRGEQVYRQICFACHQLNGQGIPGTFPPLAKSDLLLDHRPEAVAALLHGLQGPVKVNGRTYNNVMPLLNLADPQIADVLTYVSNSWGNKGSAFTAEWVAGERKRPAKDPGK